MRIKLLKDKSSDEIKKLCKRNLDLYLFLFGILFAQSSV